jgi:hypothetical protein
MPLLPVYYEQENGSCGYKNMGLVSFCGFQAKMIIISFREDV